MELLVQCDFDDTITVGNVAVALRQALAPEEWRRMEEQYVAGELSVEESNIRQFALVRTTLSELESVVLSEVVIRRGFQEFVGYCHQNAIKLVVVSSGLDLYVRPTLRRLGLADLEAHSATAKVTRSGIQVSYADPSGSSITRGFKEAYLRSFMARGHTVVYIGDGLSDITAALEADYVIARSTLEGAMRARNHPCYSFDDFGDVMSSLEDIRRSANI